MNMLTYLLSTLLAASAARADFSACFIPGESTEYKVSWMGVPLAWSATTTEAVEEGGRKLVLVRMVSQTYGAYAHIYRVDDVTEVLIDPVTALPVRLDLQIREGSREKSHLTHFDHAAGSAIFIDRLAGTTNRVELAPNTQDVLSFLYASRQRDLAAMAEEIHRIYVDGKIHDMGLLLRKPDTIDLPQHGDVSCIPVEPLAEFDGLFLRQGKIVFWISQQSPRLITCVQAKVPVGKVTVKLQHARGTGDAFWDRTEKE